MSTHVLKWVSEPGETPDKFGNRYINVSFQDGAVAYVAKPAGEVDELHKTLTELIGKEGEYLLEDTGKTTKSGSPKHKMKSWPGKPAPTGWGGGGGGSRGRSPEERDSILTQVAFKKAVDFYITKNVGREQMLEELPGLTREFVKVIQASVGGSTADGQVGGQKTAISPPAQASASTPDGRSQEAGDSSSGGLQSPDPYGEGGNGSDSPPAAALTPTGGIGRIQAKQMALDANGLSPRRVCEVLGIPFSMAAFANLPTEKYLEAAKALA